MIEKNSLSEYYPMIYHCDSYPPRQKDTPVCWSTLRRASMGSSPWGLHFSRYQNTYRNLSMEASPIS
jgi:hypothetical protein